MAKPFRKPGSKNYYVEIWSHGKRRMVALDTNNYGLARTKAGQLEQEVRTSGLTVPTRHEGGSAYPAISFALGARATRMTTSDDMP